MLLGLSFCSHLLQSCSWAAATILRLMSGVQHPGQALLSEAMTKNQSFSAATGTWPGPALHGHGSQPGPAWGSCTTQASPAIGSGTAKPALQSHNPTPGLILPNCTAQVRTTLCCRPIHLSRVAWVLDSLPRFTQGRLGFGSPSNSPDPEILRLVSQPGGNAICISASSSWSPSTFSFHFAGQCGESFFPSFFRFLGLSPSPCALVFCPELLFSPPW